MLKYSSRMGKRGGQRAKTVIVIIIKTKSHLNVENLVEVNLLKSSIRLSGQLEKILLALLDKSSWIWIQHFSVGNSSCIQSVGIVFQDFLLIIWLLLIFSNVTFFYQFFLVNAGEYFCWCSKECAPFGCNLAGTLTFSDVKLRPESSPISTERSMRIHQLSTRFSRP